VLLIYKLYPYIFVIMMCSNGIDDGYYYKIVTEHYATQSSYYK